MIHHDPICAWLKAMAIEYIVLVLAHFYEVISVYIVDTKGSAVEPLYLYTHVNEVLAIYCLPWCVMLSDVIPSLHTQ